MHKEADKAREAERDARDMVAFTGEHKEDIFDGIEATTKEVENLEAKLKVARQKLRDLKAHKKVRDIFVSYSR